MAIPPKIHRSVDARAIVNDLDESTNDILYVGGETSDGRWEVKKLDDTGTTTKVTYATYSNNPSITSYNTAWTDRATLTYTIYSGS